MSWSSTETHLVCRGVPQKSRWGRGRDRRGRAVEVGQSGSLGLGQAHAQDTSRLGATIHVLMILIGERVELLIVRVGLPLGLGCLPHACVDLRVLLRLQGRRKFGQGCVRHSSASVPISLAGSDRVHFVRLFIGFLMNFESTCHARIGVCARLWCTACVLTFPVLRGMSFWFASSSAR